MTRAFLACCVCALAIPVTVWSEAPARKRKPTSDKKNAASTTPAAEKPAVPKSPNAPPAVAVPAAAGQAVIEGRVKLPEAKAAPVKIQRYSVVSKGGVVAMSPSQAVVYLEGQFPRPAAMPKVRMVQKDFTFLPALLPVQTGTTVEFPNEDDTYHNVFSYSKAKRFDLGRYLPGEQPVPSQVFNQPGLVQLHCDIHEHMHAVILVLDTPWFVKTGGEGRFRMTGLPAGNFKLKAWLSSTQTLEMPVALTGGSTFKAEFP